MQVPELLRDIKVFGALADQSVRTEVLGGASDWAEPALDEVVVIHKMGLYGATTATYGLYKSRHVIAEEGCVLDATTFGDDWSKVSDVDLVLKGGDKLKLWVIDSAVDPLGVTIAVLGKIFNIAELRRRG